MTKAFLNRPVLATVASVLILIAGLVVIPALPISQYPQIAPPVVTVTATYTGASPQAVEAQVTTPLEQAVNTVQGLRYLSSTSAQGVSTITCTFNLGVNLDIAAADVQNAVQSSLGLLPATVQQLGIQVAKNSGAFVMGIALTSTDKSLDTLTMSNYAQLNITNDLTRVPGVSQVIIFGQRQYAMRIWLNPVKLQQQGLDANDVIGALQEQNAAIAAGSIGSPPAPKNQPYTYTVNAVTQLSDPSQFANIILRANPNGGYVRLADVARIELGAQSYTTDLRFDGSSKVVGLGVLQYPSANALDVSRRVTAAMGELAKQFPPGMHWDVAFDVTTYVNESIKEVILTLLLSIALVIGVIFLFLQHPKSTLIPAATIPVSLIGTFFVMQLFGFTINTITLFGLTLATGLVVDDAIVVIENIARHMDLNKGRQSGVASAAEAMREIQSAVVASSLVLLAVFIPVGFLPGTTGQIYKQFALTIAASIAISLFMALTLAPVLSARLLTGEYESRVAFFRAFNNGFKRFRDWYGRVLPTLFRRRWLVAIVFGGALFITLLLVSRTPQGFLPDEDLGYFITLVQAPEGTSLQGERAIAKQAADIIRAQPEVKHLFDVGGFSFSGSSPNRGIMFALLTPWGERKSPAWCQFIFLFAHPSACQAHNAFAVEQRLNYAFYSSIPKAQIFAFNPPAINGVGNFGGFQFELEDRGNVGLNALMNTAYAMMGAAAKDPRLQNVFTQFRINSPQIESNIDRNKAKSIGVSLDDIFKTMEVNLGSLYVNNFTYLNRSWQVVVQADAPYRNSVSSLGNLYVRKQSSRYSGAQDVSGTAVYMAPEQLQGRPGPASDQYALAVVVYEWLTGTPPFDGSFAELCAQHLTTMPTSIRTKNPTITPDVEHVLFMALAKDPRQRFGSVEAFARALGQANEPTYRISEGPQPVSVLQPPPPPGVQPPPSGGNLVPPPPPGMQPYQSPGMNMNVYNGQPGAMYQSGGPAAQPPVQSGFYPPPGVSGAFPPVAPNQPPFAGASQYGMQPGNNGPAQGSTPVVPQEAGLPKHDDPTVTSQRQKNAAAETEEVRAPAQPQAPATSEKKKSGKGKALAIVGTIVALLLVLAVLAPTVLLPLLQGKQAKGNSTSAANAATSTPAPTDTPTATDTVTQTDTVTATTTDTPTPIVTPPPVSTGPYTADWSKGLGDWTGSPQWKAVGDGSIGSSGDDANNPNLFAPYQAAKANYSVESKMQFVRSTQYSYDYGIVVRTTDSNDGYAAGVYNSGAYIAKMAAGKVDYYNLLQQKDLQPDTLTHVIRVDVKNNSISLYIDNVLEVQTTDNSYLDPGRVGLRAASTDVNVFSFKVTPLS